MWYSLQLIFYMFRKCVWSHFGAGKLSFEIWFSWHPRPPTFLAGRKFIWLWILRAVVNCLAGKSNVFAFISDTGISGEIWKECFDRRFQFAAKKALVSNWRLMCRLIFRTPWSYFFNVHPVWSLLHFGIGTICWMIVIFLVMEILVVHELP